MISWCFFVQGGSFGRERGAGSLDGGAECNLAAQVEGSRLARLLGHARLPRPYVRGRLGPRLQQGEVCHHDGQGEQEQQGRNGRSMRQCCVAIVSAATSLTVALWLASCQTIVLHIRRHMANAGTSGRQGSFEGNS